MDQFVIESGPPGHVTLYCRGALDLACRGDLGAACAEALDAAQLDLVVNLDDVQFIDCGSIRLLADAGRLQQRHGHFAVVCDNAFVLGVLDLTGFSVRYGVERTGSGTASARRSFHPRLRFERSAG